MSIARAQFWRSLSALPLAGASAFSCAVTAVAIPTAIRAALSGVVTGCEFTPYLPFVFISAVLLRWWLAAAVALTSVAIMGGLFQGAPYFEAACFAPAAGIFLASSAVLIVIAVLGRRAILGLLKPRDAQGVIFSLEKGEVWASWYGQGAPIRLGTQRKVSEMMEDFLAQVRLGKRLNGE